MLYLAMKSTRLLPSHSASRKLARMAMVFRTRFFSTCHVQAVGAKSENRKSIHDNSTNRRTQTNFRLQTCDASSQQLKINKNPCNVQMISDELYAQIFPDMPRINTFETDVIKRCKAHLESHNLWGKSVTRSAAVNLHLPPLQGKDINEHFYNIAHDQTVVYKRALLKLVTKGIPERPDVWRLQAGWTKYTVGEEPTQVDYPEGDAFVFDVEVCQNTGKVPTMAAAVTTDAWYSWCSELLVTGNGRDPSEPVRANELIPLESISGENFQEKSWLPRIVVGHNVAYDRACIKEQYLVEETCTRFLDTMSMHIAVSGITSFQRALKLTLSKSMSDNPVVTNQDVLESGALDWTDTSSLNNLRDVYKLYCNGKELKKEDRNYFITGTIPEIRNNFQNLMAYCALDVVATYEVLVQLLPMFFERFPHPVSFAGTLEMGQAYLPINSSWQEYIKKSEETFENLECEVKQILMQKANEALKLLENNEYMRDPWLWDLDWKIPKIRKSKKVNNTNVIPDGLPAWYRKLYYKPTDENYLPGPSNLSTGMKIVPKLLKLCWFGFPLHHSKEGGWGYLVKTVPDTSSPVKDISDLPLDEASLFPYREWEKIWNENRIRLEKTFGIGKRDIESLENDVKGNPELVAQDLRDFLKGLDALASLGLRSAEKKKKQSDIPTPHPFCEFRPLPHKDGANFKVGNPLSKDFLSKIEENILTSATDNGVINRVVRISKMLSYWRNNRDRIMSQLAVWFDTNTPGHNTAGAILPQVIVSGTLTRRAVEPTWMTASNARSDRVGSELKGMIQAPQGYHFVGADVDSQELWIASIIGDANFCGIHGCTALGWMTLQGNKSTGTDMHSKTASLIGVDRDEAKILNYARIYGAGVNFAERLLTQFNRNLSAADARVKSRAMYKHTKGKKGYQLNSEGYELAKTLDRFRGKGRKDPFSKEDMKYLLKHAHFSPNDYMDLVEREIWDGGTESHMFNRLEEIAQESCPKTPVLQCSISRSLLPATVHNDFMTSRVNWVVQSSAVDYLHLMLTSVRWLFQQYNIKGRFSLSVHDEVRFLVKSEDRYKAALALQITNLYTRAMCAYQIGMYDLPQSVAFFSSVDVDKVLRKEVNEDCKTPSNPEGLFKAYGIPHGEALDIYQLIDIVGDKLSK